ncbi:hypothetical protein BDB13_5098 [Rhodococcus sp. OK302]|nr:hypothetical protein BDB13_5098 [Rhodococcus sp. OK302]
MSFIRAIKLGLVEVEADRGHVLVPRNLADEGIRSSGPFEFADRALTEIGEAALKRCFYRADTLELRDAISKNFRRPPCMF